MPSALRYLGQAVIYAVIAVVLGYFADSPSYRHFDSDMARLTLSLAHSGDHAGECRRLTAEEIAALPPNMRKPMDCPRGRLPLLVEVELDGALIVGRSIPPSGLFGDGPSQIYENFTIPSGSHHVRVRMRDSARAEGFDFEREATIDVEPRQRLVIGFRAETGGFFFSGVAASPAAAGSSG